MSSTVGASAGTWDVTRLCATVPEHEERGTENGIRALLYRGEPYRGRPTRVFAYLGVPQQPLDAGAVTRAVPGVVCVHGGGGTAFRDWVALWNARGYAAIAMDLGGCGAERQPLADGGPPQDLETKLQDPAAGWPHHWMYHSVANVLLAHSLLRAEPGVDPERTALTGISWGGVLTCIAAGVDPRFGCAVPVYGCGFLSEGGVLAEAFQQLDPVTRDHWRRNCDPAAHLGNATLPMLFVNGTNDRHFPLDIYRRTYALPRGPVTLSVQVGLQHSHAAGWSPPEIARFINWHLCGGPALPRVGAMTVEGGWASAPVGSDDAARTVGAALAYTRDAGPLLERRWDVAPAALAGNAARARVPDGATLFYLGVTDARGAFVSCPHVAAPGA